MTAYSVSLVSGSVLNPSAAAFDKNEALASSLTVGADGYLITTAPSAINGVQLTGANWTVNINGAIGTFADGSSGLLLYGPPGLESTRTDIVNIGATGMIFSDSSGDNGFGIATQRNLIVKNKGTITSDNIGIVGLQGFTTNVTVTNSGMIYGQNFGLSFDFNLGTHKITNSGTIKSDGAAIQSAFAAGVEDITNTGTIIGNINLDLGDDKLTNSKVINGFVSMGGGADIVKNTGTITGPIYLDGGADTFIGGAKAEIVSDGDGADSYKLGAGNDIFIASGQTGSDGNDTADGGTGVDIYDATSTTNGVIVNLDSVKHDSLFGLFTNDQ